MTDKERDSWDELLRDKLFDMEAETTPDDWEAIAGRLPERKIIPLPWQRWRSYAAAAAVFLLLCLGSGSYYLYIYKQADISDAPLAEQTKPRQEVRPETPTSALIASAETQAPRTVSIRIADIPPVEITTSTIVEEYEETPTVEETKTPEETSSVRQEPLRTTNVTEFIADASVPTKSRTSAPRKWGFGMGVGGVTKGANNTVNTYLLRSSSLQDEKLLELNAPSNYNQMKAPRTNIKHKTPISFGLSASHYLSKHFSLQMGLNYTLLLSEWEAEGEYSSKTRQSLHFIGIPFALSYKIVEWNRFLVYAAAGVQAEINVAGNEQEKVFVSDLENHDIETSVHNTKVRMKEWLWSVNARAGVSYPIIRPISAFAELGAAWYFDNGSQVETLYSDKPFHFSPQVGFRLSF